MPSICFKVKIHYGKRTETHLEVSTASSHKKELEFYTGSKCTAGALGVSLYAYVLGMLKGKGAVKSFFESEK